MSFTGSAEELFHEVLVAPRRAFVPHPDTVIVERPGWMQLITPSFRQGGLNEVTFCAVPAEQADAIIDETLLQYRRLGLRFRWGVPPGTQPADLAARLARKGMAGSEVLAMYRGTDAIPRPAESQDIEIVEVDDATLADFTRVTAAGWEMDPTPLGEYHRLLLDDPRRRGRLFLARCDGQPAGAGSSMMSSRSVTLSGAVVLPAFRGRGAYRALVAARLDVAREQGLTLASTQARAETSAPILARLGFRTLCRYPVFTND